MKIFRAIVFGLLAWASAMPAHAQIAPQTGYWWNPAEPGRGYFIEIQQSAILFAGFLYAANGEATWVTSTGTMTSPTAYSGSLLTYDGGQTLTGAFKVATPSASLGNISITFTSNNQASMTWPGGTVPLQRFDIVAGGSSAGQQAGYPQTGWWYNPAEGGRGFGIEVQGGQIYLAGYMYDASGNPVWYLVNGPMSSASTFSGVWQQFAGGQTLTGAFQPAGILNADAGSITLQFADATDATLTLPAGNQIPLTRYQFGALTPGQWQPPAGATPASGNYIYLQGQAGDYVVGANTYLYTQANAVLSVSENGSILSASVHGDKTWNGLISFPGVAQLQTGFYGNLVTYPGTPQTGSVYWFGDGRGCNSQRGWLAVDNATYSGGNLVSIDLRFEQHCEGATPALNGKIHWASGDTTVPPGPIAVPAGIWQPAAGATPASGNYVYLTGQAGDYIVGANTYTYTQANAVISVMQSGNTTTVQINGNLYWTGNFQTMNSLSQLQPGYYGNLERYPFNNPATGGLNWGGNGAGCNTLTGWFAVDNVVYTAGVLTSLDMRFEQHCEGAVPAMNGKIHWNAVDNTTPPGPVVPVPTSLWQAPAGSTPASGNYLYLQSDSGDYIGQGQTYNYVNSDLAVSAPGSSLLQVTVDGLSGWVGDFLAMNSLPLQAGYYPNLERYPFNNPATGGLTWYGQGRGCNTLTGWFAIDNIAFTSGALTAIDLRFEQHCEGGTPALRGQLHWTVNNMSERGGGKAKAQ